jgi:2-methylisocitrate lyase-like PEP mutase family enzyme
VAENIAAILRNMNTELATGSQAASQLQAVPDTAEIGDALVAFYDAVTARNTDTLRTTIRSAKGYVDGGAEAIKVLAGLRKLDDRVRIVMRRAGIDISPSAGRGSPSPSTSASP